MVDHEQRTLTISEVAVDWQEPVVLHPITAYYSFIDLERMKG